MSTLVLLAQPVKPRKVTSKKQPTIKHQNPLFLQSRSSQINQGLRALILDSKRLLHVKTWFENYKGKKANVKIAGFKDATEANQILDNAIAGFKKHAK